MHAQNTGGFTEIIASSGISRKNSSHSETDNLFGENQLNC